jgi:AcrR family transcriptional regulator
MYANAMSEAARLMWERGYDRVRAEELAAVCRVSLGTFYREHGSKAAFARKVRAFAEHHLWRHADFAVEPLRGEHPDFGVCFVARWCATARWGLEHPALFCFTYLQPIPPGEEGSSPGTTREWWLELLAEGVQAGAVRAFDPVVQYALTWGALTELVYSAELRTDPRRDTDVEALARLVWEGLRRRQDVESVARVV